MAADVETLSMEQQQELMAKYDRESAFRRLRGPMARVVAVLAIIWSLLQLYTAAMGVFPPILQRAPHLGFALVLVYLLYPLKRQDRSNKIRWYDYLLALLSALVASYHVIFYEPLTMRAGAYTRMDLIISILGVVLVLEAVRRVVGWVLLTLAVIFLLYGHFGYLVPGFMGHRGFTFTRILTHSFLSTEGIFGVPIAVSSTFIFLFMIFATFLRKTGIGDWLTDLAVSVTGHYSGGPAKAAVIASALQGTVSGSSVANVVGTGSVTIPLMKSIGYRKEFAGAVEAAASTGGQLMPPIMGAAAFIMTEFTGFPYIKIAAAAAIPAIICMTPSRMPGQKSTNVSKIIEKAYEGADVSIGITRTSGASIYNQKIWDLLRDGKIRHNSMVMRDMINWIQGGALADYESLYAEGERLAVLWRQSKTIEITSPLGTNLKGNISNVVYVECGKAHKPGMQMAFSDGEVSQAPDEGTVNGTLVVDGPICYIGSHPEPVRLEIKNGRVVSCEGDPVAARRLNQIFSEVENATNVAEFGIGLNPDCLFNGDFEEEKKARGTLHMAIGANVSYGGTVYSPVHMDMVVYKPTVKMDGKLIVDNGVVVFEK